MTCLYFNTAQTMRSKACRYPCCHSALVMSFETRVCYGVWEKARVQVIIYVLANVKKTQLLSAFYSIRLAKTKPWRQLNTYHCDKTTSKYWSHFNICDLTELLAFVLNRVMGQSPFGRAAVEQKSPPCVQTLMLEPTGRKLMIWWRTVVMERRRGAWNVSMWEPEANNGSYLRKKPGDDRLTMREGHWAIGWKRPAGETADHPKTALTQ